MLVKYLLIFIIFAISWPVGANPFIGKWKINKVIENKDIPFFDEIKYPKWFEIEANGLDLIGYYKDQYDYECQFELVTLINGGAELLLFLCGTTKHSDSWSPLYKIKYKNGILHGLAITNAVLFEWKAQSVSHLPLKADKKDILSNKNKALDKGILSYSKGFVHLDTSATHQTLTNIIQKGHQHISIDQNPLITDKGILLLGDRVLGLRLLNMKQISGSSIKTMKNVGFLYLENCPGIDGESLLGLPHLKNIYLRKMAHISHLTIRKLREKGIKVVDAR